MHNIMVLIATTFPGAWFTRFAPILEGTGSASRRFLERASYIRALREHLHRHVFVRPIEEFLELNEAFARGEAIGDRHVS